MKIHNLINRRINKFCKQTMALTLAALFVIPSIMYSMSNGFKSVKAADEDEDYYVPAAADTKLIECFPDNAFARYVYSYVLGKPDYDTYLNTYMLEEEDVQTIQNYESISCGGLGCSNVTGVQNFSRLTGLSVYNNNLTSLPDNLPTGLTSLNVRANKLNSLPKLSPVLETLNVNENQLKSLPELPDSLTSLDVASNQLKSLPKLPAGLTKLNVAINQLKSLPELPTSLTHLQVQNNQLKELDLANMASLSYVFVSGQTPQFAYTLTQDGNYKILEVPTKNLSDIEINGEAYNDYDNSGSITVSSEPTSFKYKYNTGYNNTKMDVTAQSFTETSLNSISVKTPPTKTTYIEGEKFDPTDLVITLNYDNDITEDVTYSESNTDFKFSPGLEDNLTADIDKVTITYAGKSAEQDITVLELTSISVKNPPAKTSYIAGEKFDPTGLAITLNYNNDTTEDVTYSESNTNFKFSPGLEDNLTADIDKVTITYAGKSAEQDITVLELTSISVKNPPAKTLYVAGEKFDPSGLVITLNYDNGSTKEVAYDDSTKDDFTFSPDLNTALQVSHDKVTITYAGKTAEQGIPIKVFVDTTLTDEGNGVTISGSLEENASLTVSEIDTSHENYSALLESLGDGKKVLLAVDVSIINGTYKPGDNMTLTFEVDPIYNGKTATVKHLLSSGQIETYTATVIDGKIQITVTELSPFMIAIDEDPVSTDESNDYNADSDDYDADFDDYYYAEIYQTGDSSPISTLFAIITSSVMIISGYIIINRKKFLQK